MLLSESHECNSKTESSYAVHCQSPVWKQYERINLYAVMIDAEMKRVAHISSPARKD